VIWVVTMTLSITHTFLFASFIACGPKVPPELIDPYTNPPAQCDKNSHFLAQGIGATPEKSILNGQDAVSQQISSEITSSTEMYDKYVTNISTTNGQEDWKQSALNEMESLVTVKSSFAHNELIDIVIPPIKYEGQFYSLACLNKAEAGMVLYNELKPKYESYMNTAKQAVDAGNNKDVQRFSTLYTKMEKDKLNILAQFYIIYSITAKRSQEEQLFEEQWMKADKMALDLLQNVKVGVALEAKGLTTEQTKLLNSEFNKVLNNLKVPTVSKTTCTQDVSHVITITDVISNCKESSLAGMTCSPVIAATVSDCRNNSQNQISFEGGKFRGNTNKSEEETFISAISKMNNTEVLTVFYEELSTLFPVSKP